MNEERHVQAAYEQARAEKIKKLENENRELREQERILSRLLETSEAQMVRLWEEILRLQDQIDDMSEGGDT